VNAVRGIGIAVAGSFLAFGIAMVFLFVNASTLGSSDGTIWALVGSFGLGPAAAVAAAANIVCFLLAGLFAGLGVVIAWPYAIPAPPDRISFGVPVVAGMVGALVVAERLGEALRAHYEIGIDRRIATASIGVAVGPEGHRTRSAVLRMTDHSGGGSNWWLPRSSSRPRPSALAVSLSLPIPNQTRGPRHTQVPTGPC
jgi:hypothetical protein